ncbi:MAG: hypothetical protein UT14_C0018G0006 [Candidatus Shapirobacteria bacterium GW2011_GWE1_38_92]|uniref:Uncharacterized protein n=2 Tax=Candidatus Shapironibacteriota TaxID=1752721 RepID=A0A0G0JXF0_9BACT|nr:MAG: hypothetical protein US90_C0030G0006 [Candidatus Shapirobacteria bacterium GW2011_GWE2_38_30]KKQ91251.1 MAG: hypothetical protein UT14_C0018G0006 [Candidatus Shapirobacteria bacterium GW2011_GWE1_38_92]
MVTKELTVGATLLQVAQRILKIFLPSGVMRGESLTTGWPGISKLSDFITYKIIIYYDINTFIITQFDCNKVE